MERRERRLAISASAASRLRRIPAPDAAPMSRAIPPYSRVVGRLLRKSRSLEKSQTHERLVRTTCVYGLRGRKKASASTVLARTVEYRSTPRRVNVSFVSVGTNTSGLYWIKKQSMSGATSCRSATPLGDERIPGRYRSISPTSEYAFVCMGYNCFRARNKH
jgi:hypothetical protein